MDRIRHNDHIQSSILQKTSLFYLTMPAAKLEQLWRVAPFQVAVS
jgi:hypothetical protein